MKRLFVLLVGFQSSWLFAANPAKSLLSCWDGTFAYDVFRIEKTDKNLYVSLRGKWIDKKQEFLLINNSEFLTVGRHEFGRGRRHEAIMAVFSLSQCQIEETKQTYACEAGNTLSVKDRTAIYLSRYIDDLGKDIPLISKFGLSKLNLVASPVGLTLTSSFQLEKGGKVTSTSLKVQRYSQTAPTLVCNKKGNDFSPYVPQRLIDFSEP
jgi:hypothetical protein